MRPEDSDYKNTNLYIPTRTFLKIGLALLAGAIIVKLAPLFSLLVIAIILAVAVEPILLKGEAHLHGKYGRPFTISTIAIVVLIGVLFIGIEVLPPLTNQISIVAARLPGYVQKHLADFKYGPQIYHELEAQFKTGAGENAGAWFGSVVAATQAAVEGLGSVVLVYVLFVYFMVDGPRAYKWTTAFFRTETRAKIDQTAKEVSTVVSAYILGQVITSILAGIYVYIVLRILGVPAALMLAVLAAVFDALPVLGFFLSLIPAIMFALTVSSHTALIVVALYVLYHLLENYLICPLVYGNRMRMSGLVVLLAFLAGGLVAGLPGALVILPIAASYPIVEKIWLRHVVQGSALRDHADET